MRREPSHPIPSFIPARAVTTINAKATAQMLKHTRTRSGCKMTLMQAADSVVGLVGACRFDSQRLGFLTT